jgi:alanine racemase
VTTFPSRPAWIEVDSSALTNNVRKLRRRLKSGTRLMAVVKANAYGHGAAESAATLVRAGADALAVATVGEAIVLRRAAIECPILVLGYTPPWLTEEALRYTLTLTVYDHATAAAYAQQVAAAGGVALGVHVKVNTGMNRLGVEPAETADLIAALHALGPLHVEGIFTHFATSDESDKQYAWQQFRTFQEVLTVLQGYGLRPPLAHAANSAAALTMPETHLDMVRAGIALYGLDPDADECQLPDGFRPALSWKAVLAQVRRLQPGDAVSYGREFIADRPMRVGVVPVGYADGFVRKPNHWGYVLVRGQPAPILGRVCMDQTVVDLGPALLVDKEIAQGDEVVLIGRQGDRRMTAEEVAARVGTNNYDIVSHILDRVPRYHSGGG